MKGEWCYWNKFFSDEKCDKILKDGLLIPPQEAKLGVAGLQESTDTKVRRSKIRFIQKTDPKFEWLFDDMWKVATRCNHDFFNFHITNLSYMQLAEYDESYQGEYKMHQDVFWINNDQYHRKLTCVVQLTDPNEYEGGDFQMFGLSYTPQNEQVVEMKNRGSVIIIPSFVNHAAAPVTKGRRYSLAVWFEGPKWV